MLGAKETSHSAKTGGGGGVGNISLKLRVESIPKMCTYLKM